MKLTIIPTFLLASTLTYLTLTAQENSAPDNKGIETVSALYKIQDTLSRDNTSVTLRVLWMDSLLEIRKTTSLKYDLEYARKFRKDPTYIPTKNDTITYNELRRIGSQNCHSYALEKYFKYHNVSENTLFTDKTILTQNMYMEKILTTSFKKGLSIKTKPRKNLNYPFEIGTLLVFRNKWNTPIHTVFYDGEYHSKYGGWAPKAEKKLKTVFDRYWDTTTIEEYKLDTAKLENYITRKQD